MKGELVWGGVFFHWFCLSYKCYLKWCQLEKKLEINPNSHTVRLNDKPAVIEMREMQYCFNIEIMGWHFQVILESVGWLCLCSVSQVNQTGSYSYFICNCLAWIWHSHAISMICYGWNCWLRLMFIMVSQRNWTTGTEKKTTWFSSKASRGRYKVDDLLPDPLTYS